MNLKPSNHQLLVALLYAIVFVFLATANLGIDTAGMSIANWCLNALAATLLGGAAVNGVRAGLVARCRDVANQNHPSNSNALVLQTPSSTNALVFSLCHTSASTSFLLLDIINNSAPLPRALRMLSTLLWMNYAVAQGWFAIKHDRKREAKPGLIMHKPCGLNRSTMNHAYEWNFFLSAIFLAASTYIDTTLSPQKKALKGLGTAFWMIGGLLDLCKTYRELGKENKIVPSTIQLPSTLAKLSTANTQPNENKGCHIVVLPDDAPSGPPSVPSALINNRK